MRGSVSPRLGSCGLSMASLLHALLHRSRHQHQPVDRDALVRPWPMSMRSAALADSARPALASDGPSAAQNVQFWITPQAWRTSLRLCADVRAAGWGAAPRQLLPAGYSGCLVIACTEPDLGWPAGVTASCVRLWSECALAGHAGKMNQAQAVVIVAAELRLFLRPGRRSGPVAVVLDGTSSLGHVVESLGVPLTEAGRLLVNGEPGRARVPAVQRRCGDRRGCAATAAAGAGTFCSRCSPGHAGAPAAAGRRGRRLRQ